MTDGQTRKSKVDEATFNLPRAIAQGMKAAQTILSPLLSTAIIISCGGQSITTGDAGHGGGGSSENDSAVGGGQEASDSQEEVVVATDAGSDAPTLSGPGQPCDATHPCEPGLTCTGGFTVSNPQEHTCQ
jgi:hypothetical protein